jgi:uncharacterized protein YceH (UPF0502 family)
VDADPVEIRVLGCLIEKQRTTPDVYPLSLNALRSACNQSTSRDPIVVYDEPAIRGALERLGRKRWARLTSGPGSRAAKYRHLLDEALELADPELALLCVLMLRGPQTSGELKQRTERMQGFDSLEEVERALDSLIERRLVARLARRPGQKEQRYAQLLGGGEAEGVEPASTAVEYGSGAPAAAEATDPRLLALEARVGRLEEELVRIRAVLETLREP